MALVVVPRFAAGLGLAGPGEAGQGRAGRGMAWRERGDLRSNRGG